MPRLKPRRLAHAFAIATILGASACGAVDLGSHSRDAGGGGAGGIGDASTEGGSLAIGAACGSRGLPPCAPDLYCRHEIAAQCGALDQPGTCQSVPTVCTSDVIDVEVCGCDGITYPNLCSATFARTSPKAEGPCPSAGDGGAGAACGTRGLAPCASPLVCIYPQSARCGEVDQPGTCRAVSAAAVCPSVVTPVCGCDGKNYTNECRANGAGTSVRSPGDCP